ncbi:hypothetical protein V1460_20105 [Streptomyces sp. SCSIO 30461]|uniref:hypothetical protein n=1 Tax=Streptomyces sp. SCSIO 30461 TaxID=3118085 RepID=UPI0030CACA81
MRATAAGLGKITMALYGYVADRDKLESPVVESVRGAVDATPSARGGLRQERVAVMTEHLWERVGPTRPYCG